MSYAHTQRGGMHWLLWASAAVLFVGAWAADHDGERLWIVGLLFGMGILVVLLGFCFVSLTVRDAGEALDVRFGPIALFKKQIAYESITSARPGRSILLDGFGVHWFPGRGWTWNLWTFDCVDLVVDGDPMRIGSDDKVALAAFLESRIGENRSGEAGGDDPA